MLKKSFRPFPALTTSRLTLRKLKSSDNEAIQAIRSDPQVNQNPVLSAYGTLVTMEDMES